MCIRCEVTYKEFRTWALSEGWTGRKLAPYMEADEPLKTATRILVLLAGTHFDDQPLPYPKLCQLYHAVSLKTMSTPTAHVDLDTALTAGRKDHPWLKPGQFTISHKFCDPYLHVTLDADAPGDGIKTLAHLAGGLYLETDKHGPRKVRLPYEVLCRLAGRQWRARGDQVEKAPEVTDAAEAPRLCRCGVKLTGQASQRFCSARCRKQGSRANPLRIAKSRGSKSVTATIATRGVSHLVEATRRADGSLRDTFSGKAASQEFLSRASDDSREHNERTKLKAGYQDLVGEFPELFA
jgi:hypothetical protein